MSDSFDEGRLICDNCGNKETITNHEDFKAAILARKLCPECGVSYISDNDLSNFKAMEALIAFNDALVAIMPNGETEQKVISSDGKTGNLTIKDK